MIDTNVLISALLFPDSSPALALLKVATHHQLILSDHIISEFLDIVNRKRPDLSAAAGAFLEQLSYETVAGSRETSRLIGDVKDQPILDAAIIGGVDIIVSGGKHFLRLDLERPKTMPPAVFLALPM
jgi:predicted nucleic acid-binding protein